MSERDEMKARAETAPLTRASKLPLPEIVARAKKQDGHGLTPSEVIRMAIALDDIYLRFNEYDRCPMSSHRFVGMMRVILFGELI